MPKASRKGEECSSSRVQDGKSVLVKFVAMIVAIFTVLVGNVLKL